jgi:hypothetical protein
MDRTEPSLSSNRPPSVAELVEEATRNILDALDLEGHDLAARRDELMAGVARVPATVEDADTAQRCTDFAKQLGAFLKAAEARRVASKEPVLAAGRALDGWYSRLADPVAAGKRSVEGKLTVYQRAMAEAERRRREEAERKAREGALAARKEAEARAAQVQHEADLAAAIEAERAAEQAEAEAAAAAAAAAARPAELHHDRGDLGGRSALRTDWVGEVVDRDELDLEALRPHLALDALEKAVRAFVRAGGRELSGARIYQTSRSVVR